MNMPTGASEFVSRSSAGAVYLPRRMYGDIIVLGRRDGMRTDIAAIVLEEPIVVPGLRALLNMALFTGDQAAVERSSNSERVSPAACLTGGFEIVRRGVRVFALQRRTRPVFDVLLCAQLERNPEKWKPVFRQIARKSRNLDHDPIQSEWIMV